MVKGMRRVLGALAVVSVFTAGPLVTGCAVSKEDVHRWANRSQGPRRLIAVVTHDRYPMDLRIEAVRTLIEMKPRKGRRIGLEGGDDTPSLATTLAQLPPAQRSELMGRIVPILLEEMAKPEPKGSDQGLSAAYKDATFSLLTYDDRSLLDEQSRSQLRQALAQWVTANFVAKLDDSNQLFGVEQVVKELKAEGVRALPQLITPAQTKVDRVAQLIAELGDAETKNKASQALVTVAQSVDSPAWLKEKRAFLAEQNKASKLSPTEAQFKQQLELYQEEELLRVFSSMKKVGQKPSVSYLLGYAKNTSNAPKRRAAALAALEGNLDRSSNDHADALLVIAGSDETPDVVRQVALSRVGEMPRKMVADKLFALFSNKRWQVRWVAAELVLKMSNTSQIDEFMTHIGRAQGMAISEPLQYGTLIGGMKGPPPPIEVVRKYSASNYPVQVRLSALGYYYRHGTASEVAAINQFTSDTMAVPQCARDAEDCEWKCTVGNEAKPIKTVGEYVEYCIKPALSSRAQAALGEGPQAPKKG